MTHNPICTRYTVYIPCDVMGTGARNDIQHLQQLPVFQAYSYTTATLNSLFGIPGLDCFIGITTLPVLTQNSRTIKSGKCHSLNKKTTSAVQHLYI